MILFYKGQMLRSYLFIGRFFGFGTFLKNLKSSVKYRSGILKWVTINTIFLGQIHTFLHRYNVLLFLYILYYGKINIYNITN